MRQRADLKTIRIFVLILILITIIIVAYADMSEESKMENEYIEVEKEVYNKGEKVRIELENDGSATWSPLSQHLGIYHKESGELVFDGDRDIAMPAVPKTQTFFWNQTDMDGKQVPAGRYKAVFMDNYEVEFVIES